MINPAVKGLRCLKCNKIYPAGQYFEGCPSCRTEKSVSNLTVVYDYAEIKRTMKKEMLSSRSRNLWRYWELLPVPPSHAVTLSEGMTPLSICNNLGEELGLSKLYIKDESRNPTWSFKDRLCSVAVSHAKTISAPAITAYSTGNHGAAAAAYAAKAGLPCIIFTLKSVPKTMKTLMLSYGAKVITCNTFEERWLLIKECVNHLGWYPVTGFTNPPAGSNYYGIEGYKTIAYEIAEDFCWEVPEIIVLPVCYADGLNGIWKGFKEFKELGFIDRLPKLVAVEPFGPLTNALEKGLDYVEEVPKSFTLAFSIAANISTFQGLQALKESNGTALTVSDQEIMEMQHKLAGLEGVYSEMSAVTSLVGAAKIRESGFARGDDRIVCLLTSTGLKDPESTFPHAPEIPVVNADLKELTAALNRYYGFNLE